MTLTRAFPSTQMPPPRFPLGGVYNYLTGFISKQALLAALEGAIDRGRAEVLGMSPDSFWGPSSTKNRSLPLLYGFSTMWCRRPSDWNPNIRVTGYWFMDGVSGWCPPDDLVDFLQAGAPPVYIGFGSMNNRDPEQGGVGDKGSLGSWSAWHSP